mmetsp:Transcript_13830/g.30113  ORF Transcript_13830/g.30113 Transcript_13830/m.30113 type:complete len:89 (+) Transcript_13830:945-1211(+)
MQDGSNVIRKFPCFGQLNSTHNYEVTISFKPATNNIGTLANGLDVITFSNKYGLRSKPKPRGIEIEMTGRASRALEIREVARTGVKGS